MPPPAVSVLTALRPRPGTRLPEIHAALSASSLDWEWLIQVDDVSTPALPDAVADDARVRVEANGAHLGIALTRNRALARTRAPLLLNADSDDVPVAGFLDRLATAFDDPEVGLSFGAHEEHWPDGGVHRPDIRFAPGRLAPGTIAAIWRDEEWVPMHLAGAMWRTSAVVAAGGWMALAGGSDIGLLLGVDAGWASHYTPGIAFRHIHHGDQATASRAFQETFRTADLELLRARARALHGAADRSAAA